MEGTILGNKPASEVETRGATNYDVTESEDGAYFSINDTASETSKKSKMSEKDMKKRVDDQVPKKFNSKKEEKEWYRLRN